MLLSTVCLTSHSVATCVVYTFVSGGWGVPKEQLRGQSNPSKAKRECKVLSLEKIKILDHVKSGMLPAKVGLLVRLKRINRTFAQ